MNEKMRFYEKILFEIGYFLMKISDFFCRIAISRIAKIKFDEMRKELNEHIAKESEEFLGFSTTCSAFPDKLSKPAKKRTRVSKIKKAKEEGK